MERENDRERFYLKNRWFRFYNYGFICWNSYCCRSFYSIFQTVSYGHPIKPHPIATGYFNADGKPDVAVISSEYIQSSYLLSIYLNNHMPTITNNTLTGTQNEILAFVKTDFTGNNSDGDGDPITGLPLSPCRQTERRN
ncbi:MULTISPECIES: FG-GAP repeat domain-containing protein [unclassified Paenibacillus]|uniref:FG-GAP repeat domain-containing protein n=1 Tax=unclassified Paenibacillus TaxID=185978 RepID=UPI00362DFABE